MMINYQTKLPLNLLNYHSNQSKSGLIGPFLVADRNGDNSTLVLSKLYDVGKFDTTRVT